MRVSQMKKTRDAAMVIIERMYGARPRFNYFIGTSQGAAKGLPSRSVIQPTTTASPRTCRSSARGG
jgi:hypothetical protein